MWGNESRQGAMFSYISLESPAEACRPESPEASTKGFAAPTSQTRN